MTKDKIDYRRLLTSIPLIIFVLLTGCSQQVAPIRPNSPLPLITTEWTSPGFANPLNPYDSIEKLHNLGMDYVYTMLAGSTDTNLAETYECQFFHERWGYSADTLKMFIDSIKYWEQHGTIPTVLDSLQDLWNAYPHFPIYIREADSIALDTTMDPDSALTAIESIEDSIVFDASVTTPERNMGLPFLAFIRYSYAYCHNSGSIGKWPAVSRVRRSKTPIPTGDATGSGVGEADWTGAAGGACGGFVGGTIGGGLVGMSGGPVGAVMGAAGGGIGGFMMGGLTGGLGASLTKALDGSDTNFWDSAIGSFVGAILTFL